VLKACYETARNKDASTWIKSSDSPIAFQELAGNLYFSNNSMGVWVYRPSLVVEKNKQLKVSSDYEWSDPDGESSVITPVVFSTGLNPEHFEYITKNDLPTVPAMCAHGPVLVYAEGNTLYYSDDFLPNNINAKNLDIIPVTSDITAVASNGQQIFIFSKNETWALQTTIGGGKISGGVLTQLSNEVGCISAQSITSIGNTPVWLSDNGVYAISGQFSIAELSEDIREYWRGGISDPYSHYTTQSGLTGLSNTQPTSFSRDSEKPFISYNEKYKELYCSFKEKTWVMSEGWFIWDYSTAYDSTPIVKASEFIQGHSLLSLHGETYMVGLNPPAVYDDTSTVASAVDVTSLAYSIHELGRGGGTDNSISGENKSIVEGRMRSIGLSSIDDTSYHLELYEINEAGEYVYLIQGVPPNQAAATAPAHWIIKVGFDTTNWEPVVTVPGGVLLDYQLPHERIASKSGYIRADRVDEVTNVQSGTGGAFLIEYDNAAFPQNLNLKQKNPLIYIKFIPTSTNLGTNTMGFYQDAGWFGSNYIEESIGVPRTAETFAWEQSYRPDLPNNTTGNPVEYVMKGTTLESDTGLQMRTRGLYSSITSHGKASLAASSYPFGLYNAAFGSDKRLFDAQVIDGDNQVVEVSDKTSIRTRTQDSAGGMTYKTFGNTYYGDPADATVGNLLIDDEQIDTIAFSTSTRGESITTMVFGFIRDKAEVIKIHSINMAYKVVGATRRRGR